MCEGEIQSQLLSTTSSLWFWRRIRFVVHFRDEFLSFCVVEHHVLKINLLFSTNITAFFRYIGLLETDIFDSSDTVSQLIYRVFR